MRIPPGILPFFFALSPFLLSADTPGKPPAIPSGYAPITSTMRVAPGTRASVPVMILCDEALSPEEKLARLRALAKGGDVQAQYYLGWALRSGVNKIPVGDPAEAWHWLELAAQAGDRNAMCELAEMESERRSPDTAQPIRWLTRVSAMEDLQTRPVYLRYLAGVYERGDVPGIPRDTAKARQTVQQAALINNQFSHPIQYDLGVMSFEKYTPEGLAEGIRWFRMAAEGGDTLAQMKMGELLPYTDASHNLEDTFYWTQKAAADKNEMACRMMSNALYFGLGTPRDAAQSFAWMEITLQKSRANIWMQHYERMALAHARGDGVEKSPDKARAYWMRAQRTRPADPLPENVDYAAKRRALEAKAAAGDSSARLVAQTDLLPYYFYGIGGPADMDKLRDTAAQLSQKSGVGAKGLFYLGLCALDGVGMPPDPARAFACFQAAGQEGNTEALRLLAYCYAEGIGTEKSTEKARLVRQEIARALYTNCMNGYSPTLPQ